MRTCASGATRSLTTETVFLDRELVHKSPDFCTDLIAILLRGGLPSWICKHCLWAYVTRLWLQIKFCSDLLWHWHGSPGRCARSMPASLNIIIGHNCHKITLYLSKVASVHVSVDQQKIKYFRAIHIQIMNDTVELSCLTFGLRQSVMNNPRL